MGGGRGLKTYFSAKVERLAAMVEISESTVAHITFVINVILIRTLLFDYNYGIYAEPAKII